MELVFQLTSGMAGWLTFEQMREGVDNLAEATLYKPLEEIASGRHFEVKSQFPIPKKTPGKGAPKTIDLVLVDRSVQTMLALEVKYKKPGSEMAGSLSADARKLREFNIAAAEDTVSAGGAGQIKRSVAGFTLVKALLFVWRSAHGLKHVVEKEDEAIKKQLQILVRKMLPEGVELTAENLRKCFLGDAASKPVTDPKYGSLVSGSTLSNERFWVASFIECELWDNL
jgi:hypothetical protein